MESELIKKFLYGAGAVLLVIIIIFTVRYILKRGETKLPPESFTLTWWQPSPNSNYEALKPFIEEYQKKHKNITINYVEKDINDYEEELVNALAEGRGPDIFSLKNDWTVKHLAKLATLPEGIMTKKDYGEAFIKPVKDDLIINGQIYGFALSADSLGLFYNEDLLDQTRIYNPPQVWNEVLKVAQKATLKRGGTIIRSGVALGTAYNTNYAFDILSLLMLQKGTPMISEDGKKAYFNLPAQTDSKVYFPGTEALGLYTSFSSPKKSNYSWNSRMGKSIEAFVVGKAAIFIGYASDLSYIKKRAPRLNFEVAPLPQMRVGDDIYYSSFWAEVTSKNSRYKEAAFDFLKFLTSKENLRDYYQTSYEKEGKYLLTSRQDLLEYQEARPYLEDFVKALDKAKNWPKADGKKFEEIFLKMITNVTEKKLASQQAIDTAAKEITTILEKEVK